MKVIPRALSPALPSRLGGDGGLVEGGQIVLLSWCTLAVSSWPLHVSGIQMLAVSLLRLLWISWEHLTGAPILQVSLTWTTMGLLGPQPLIAGLPLPEHTGLRGPNQDKHKPGNFAASPSIP